MSILLGILTFVLILVSLFIVLVVLAQKSKDGGMGAALGGGAAEAAFGAETGNVLSKSTIVAAILFFVLAFALYLGKIYENKHPSASAGSSLPAIAPTAPASIPVTTAPAPGTSAAPAAGGVTLPPTSAQATSTPAATTTPAATPAPEAAKKQP